MDIYLSINNREQVMKFPVLPSAFTVTKPQKNDTFETISQGELKLIGLTGLKSISFSSFFPVRDYPFLRDRSDTGFGYVYTIDTWIARRVPMRLIITDTPINMAVVIDSFEYTVKADGDLAFSISFSEFKFI